MTANNGTDSIKNFLEKYKFHHPTPEDVQKKIQFSQNKALIKILKKSGTYTYYRHAVLSFFLKLRNKGISIKAGTVNFFVPAFTFAAAGILFFLTAFILQPLLFQNEYYVKNGFVIFLSGDVKLKKTGSELKQLNLKDVISKNDIIVTGKDSSAALQIGNSNLVLLKPESEIKFLSINENYLTAAQLNFGKSLFKITKTGKNIFHVRMQNYVVEVQGTEFSVSTDGKESLVALEKGKLEITKDKQDKYILNEGNTSVLNEKYTSRAVSNDEKIDFKRIELLSFHKDIKDIKIEELKKTNNNLIEENIKIDKELKFLEKNEDIPLTLEAIKEKYGILQEIILFNGKIFKGYVVDRGEFYTIILPGSIIKIKTDEVDKVKKL
jgi:hypothetical protein